MSISARNKVNDIIMGQNIRYNLRELFKLIPELLPLVGFEQNNPYHCHDVLEHTLVSVEAAPSDITLRLTMLLHDIAKPACYTVKNGIGHFYGHPKVSSDMSKEILARLGYDSITIENVAALILYHDDPVSPKARLIRRWLGKIGEHKFRQLIEVKRADAKAQSKAFKQNKLELLDKVLDKLDLVKEQQQLFAVKGLAINGRDLLNSGVISDLEIGLALSYLTKMVREGSVVNDKNALMELALEWRFIDASFEEG